MALRNPQSVDYALVLYGPARIHESLNGAKVGFFSFCLSSELGAITVLALSWSLNALGFLLAKLCVS